MRILETKSKKFIFFKKKKNPKQNGEQSIIDHDKLGNICKLRFHFKGLFRNFNEKKRKQNKFSISILKFTFVNLDLLI